MRLAVFTKNLTNPAYEAARLGAERAAALWGAEVRHYVPRTPDDVDQQIALVDEALAWRPDAVVFSPVHATRVDGAIRRIAAAGLPLVGFVNPITAVPCVSYVGSDDHALALGIAHHLFRHLGGEGRVLVVGGPADAYTSRERLRGFIAAARGYPGIELTEAVEGRYDRGIARERCSAWLRVHGAPAGCLAANDIMAVGVLDALEALGQRATVVGVNAIPEAIRAIAAGLMLATADFNAMQMAYLATECALRHLSGEVVPPHIELPVHIVDRSNCTTWDLPYAQRPVITLAQLGSPT